MTMHHVGYLPIDIALQGALVAVSAYFFYRTFQVYRAIEVGGGAGAAAKKFMIGLFFITLSEIMGFAVVLTHLPTSWAKLYAVTPQIAGFLFVFLGLTELMRSFDVI